MKDIRQVPYGPMGTVSVYTQRQHEYVPKLKWFRSIVLKLHKFQVWKQVAPLCGRHYKELIHKVHFSAVMTSSNAVYFSTTLTF